MSHRNEVAELWEIGLTVVIGLLVVVALLALALGIMAVWG